VRVLVQYLLGEFWRYFLLFLGIFVFVYLLVDFLDRIDNFIEYRSTGREVLAYYVCKMPFILLQTSAVSVQLAVIVTLGLMHRHNEIVVLKAAGFSIYRLSLPLILVSVFISLITFSLAEGVVPQANLKAHELWYFDMRHNEARSKARFSRYKGWYRSERAVYNIRRFLPNRNIIEGVSLYFFDDKYNLTRRVDAQRAVYQDGVWRFHQGTDKTIGPDGVFKVDSFEDKVLVLPEKPADFQYTEKTADQMSLAELDAHIAQLGREGYDTTAYRVDRQVKFSLPFVCAVLTVLAVPLTLRLNREASMAQGVGLGIGVAFVYLVFFGLSRSLGHSGNMPIFMAAWLPNIVFTLTGLYLLVSLRQ